MENFKKKAAAKEQELTQLEDEASGASDDNEEKRIREKMEELQNEARSQATLKRDLEAEAKLAQQPVRQAQRELKKLEGDKKIATQALNRAQKRLKEAREELVKKAGNAEKEAARRTAQLQDTEEALTVAKAETDQVREAVGFTYRAYEEQEPEYDQAKQAVASIEKQCHAVKSKLRQLSSSESNDPAAIFGQKCSQMARKVSFTCRCSSLIMLANIFSTALPPLPLSDSRIQS